MISDTTRETLQKSKWSLELLLFSVFGSRAANSKSTAVKQTFVIPESTFVSKKATKKKYWGGTRIWTKGLSDCSRLLYHWAIPPTDEKRCTLHICFSSEVTKTQRTLFTNATFCYELTILGFNYFYALEDVQSIDFGRKIGSDRRIIFFLSFTFSSLKIQMLKENREVSI